MKVLLNKYLIISLITVIVSLLLTSVVWAAWSNSTYWWLREVEEGDVCTDSVLTGLVVQAFVSNDAIPREPPPFEFIFYDAASGDIESDDFPGDFDEVGRITIETGEFHDLPDSGAPSDCNDFGEGFHCGVKRDSWRKDGNITVLEAGTTLYLEILNGDGNPFENDTSSPAIRQSDGSEYEFTVENCTPPTPPEINLAQTGPGTTDSLVSDTLVFQVEAYDPSVGNNDGDGIDYLEMSILDADEMEVYENSDESNAKYCAFEGDGPCDVWNFANHDYEWPDGTPIKNGGHTLRATAYADSGSFITVDFPIQIQLPIFGNWTQIGPNSTANTVTDALVGQIEAYLGAPIDGKDVDKVEFTLTGPDGQEVYDQKTEDNAPYCLFGGSSPCPVHNFADNDYEWPDGGPPILHGTHTLTATIFAEEPDDRTLTKTFVFDIQMPSIIANLAQTGPGTTDPLVTDALVFQAEAYIGAGNADGTNIDNVDMSIIDPTGNKVHQRTENNAKYCIFGGGEPNCNQWVFADHDYKWPGGDEIKNGNHTLRVTVNTKDGRSETVDFSIQIDNPELQEPTNPVYLPIIIRQS